MMGLIVMFLLLIAAFGMGMRLGAEIEAAKRDGVGEADEYKVGGTD